MKIHLTLIRIVFFFLAFVLIATGGLAMIQHWVIGKWLLGAGLVLAAIMLAGGNWQKNLLIVCRVLLIVTAAGTLLFGTLFFIQNWQAGTILLGIGIPLSLILLLDMLVTKKVF